MAEPGRQLTFKTTAADEQVIEAIRASKYGGLSNSALLRLALRGWAEHEGIWPPPKADAAEGG